jgi:hypothetical protein
LRDELAQPRRRERVGVFVVGPRRTHDAPM